jgi:Bacterial alpha-L-rhamnosidase C-terminal domain
MGASAPANIDAGSLGLSATGRPFLLIESEWRLTGDAQLKLQVTVPPGTAADIRLPAGRIETAEPGRWAFDCDHNGDANA